MNTKRKPKYFGSVFINECNKNNCFAILEENFNPKNISNDIKNKLKFINIGNLDTIKSRTGDPITDILDKFSDIIKRSGEISEDSPVPNFFKNIPEKELLKLKNIFKDDEIIAANRKILMESVKCGRKNGTEELRVSARYGDVFGTNDAIILTRRQAHVTNIKTKLEVEDVAKRNEEYYYLRTVSSTYKYGLCTEHYLTYKQPDSIINFADTENNGDQYKQYDIMYLDMGNNIKIIYASERDVFEEEEYKFSRGELKLSPSRWNFQDQKQLMENIFIGNGVEEVREFMPKLQGTFGQTDFVVVTFTSKAGKGTPIKWDEVRRYDVRKVCNELTESDYQVLQKFANLLVKKKLVEHNKRANVTTWTHLVMKRNVNGEIILGFDKDKRRHENVWLGQQIQHDVDLYEREGHKLVLKNYKPDSLTAEIKKMIQKPNNQNQETAQNIVSVYREDPSKLPITIEFKNIASRNMCLNKVTLNSPCIFGPYVPHQARVDLYVFENTKLKYPKGKSNQKYRCILTEKEDGCKIIIYVKDEEEHEIRATPDTIRAIFPDK